MRALKSYVVGGWMVHLDYNVSSLALVCQKSNVNPKRDLKSYGWVVVVVHLDYNVSSWPWFGQKLSQLLGSKPALKSSRWVGGGWCTWIITSALGPGLVRSQLLGMLRFG